MPAGNGVNCRYCPELELGRCDGTDEGCLCYKCPRHLGQCKCVKYCRETESILIFDDENGIMNKSLLDVGGDILSISQFTLYADSRKGRRPSYVNALNGAEAIKLYDIFNDKLKNHVKVETGIFGAEMEVSITNDGPITIILERTSD